MAVPPRVRSYAREDAEQLQARLAWLAEHTLITSITAPEDVLLNVNCRTVEGDYRLSTLALRQICSLVAAGLSALLADISGMRRTSKNRIDAVVSTHDAVQIYNLCVQRRFYMAKGLFNRQLVINERTRTIDGVLGAGYRYLPHSDLVAAINEAMSEHPDAPQFDRAFMVGRYLEVTWRSPQAVVMGPDRHPVYVGYHVNNSEAGECSVGASAALLLGDARYRALLPVTQSNRTIHAGRSFGRKLAITIGNMLLAGGEISNQANRIQQLARMPLMLVDDAGKLKDARVKKLIGRLARAGIRRDIAGEVVRSTAWGGGYGAIPPNFPTAAAAHRTGYDLFARLCHTAATYSYELRESLERVAFELLRGDVRLEV